jgi:AAA15 family ATPase/GTPase
MNVLFILALLILIIVVTSLVMFVIKKGKRLVTVKFTHWLLGGYLCLLVICVVVAPFMSMEFPEKASAKEKSRVHFYGDLHKGDLEDIDADFLVVSETYPFEEPTLKISTIHNMGGLIYVERTADLSGKFEAFVYNTGVNVHGYYFKDKAEPIQLEMIDDTLRVVHSTHTTVKMTVVEKDFTTQQFSSEKQNNNLEGPDEAVYLRIPKDMKITGADVIYVGE